MTQQYPRSMTEEEVLAIRNSIMLPMLLDVCRNNLEKLEFSGLTLKKLYTESTQVLMDHIARDIKENKQFLREHQIRIIDENHGQLRYKFIVRGYEDKMVFFSDYFRAQLSIKLGEYVAGVFK